MTKYLKLRNPKFNRDVFFKDKKFCSIKNIPKEIVNKLEYELTLTVDEPVEVKTDTTDKKCIFDSKEGLYQRAVSGQIVYLCEDCYYAKTIGEIAAQLKG